MTLKLLPTAMAVAFLSVILSFVLLHPFRPSHLPRGPGRGSLHDSEILPIIGAVGPESLAFDPYGGGPYTGVSDGRILRWNGKERVWNEFAVTSPQREECKVWQVDSKMEHICGRPLGLRFDEKTGDLYVADAYFGLLMVGPNGGRALPLVSQAQGVPLGFTNDLDMDHETGAIYFSDSSTQFQRREFLEAIISGDNTGRIMKYDRESMETTILLDGLSFPNGVALSKDGSFILIAETTNCRILRHWLRTSKSGTTEVFAHLPGFPDNIRRNPNGDFWVALHSKRGKILEWLLSCAWLGKASLILKQNLNVDKLYSFIAIWRRNDALGFRLSEEGEVLEMLEDKGGRILKYISEIEERNSSLWIGSVVMPFVGVYKL